MLEKVGLDIGHESTSNPCARDDSRSMVDHRVAGSEQHVPLMKSKAQTVVEGVDSGLSVGSSSKWPHGTDSDLPSSAETVLQSSQHTQRYVSLLR